MGKIYLRPAGVDRPVPGSGEREQGPDADDPALTLEVWRERIRRHPGELKNLLRNQAFVAGIGNAYSDEILHAAGLLPFRKRASLAPEEVDALYDATRATLADAIDVLRERVPPTFEKQVRDFLAVHDKGGQPCPRCGTQDHRGPRRRVHHLVLPRLPALTDVGQGIFRTWPILRLDGSLMPLRLADGLRCRPELGRDPDQGVAGLDLVACGSRAQRTGPVARMHPFRADAGGTAVGSVAALATGSRAAPRRRAGRCPDDCRGMAIRRSPRQSCRWSASPGRSRRTRAAMSAMSTAWPVDRSELRIGTVIESRPWSRTTGVVRAIGRGKVGARSWPIGRAARAASNVAHVA